MRIVNNTLVTNEGKPVAEILKTACKDLAFVLEVRIRDNKAALVLPDSFYEKGKQGETEKVYQGLKAVVVGIEALEKAGVPKGALAAATFRTVNGERKPWLGIWVNTDTAQASGSIGQDWNSVLESRTAEYLSLGGDPAYLGTLAAAPGVAAAMLNAAIKKLQPEAKPAAEQEPAKTEKTETAVEAF
jgi:hypothetical protein